MRSGTKTPLFHTSLPDGPGSPEPNCQVCELKLLGLMYSRVNFIDKKTLIPYD